jgi:hypothetical protein
MKNTGKEEKNNINKIAFDKLKIQIDDGNIHPIDREEFSGEILNSDKYKIYVVMEGEKFLYVGKTKQAIGDKFRQSFLAFNRAEEGMKKMSGYSGYKWIKKYMNKKRSLNLFVFNPGDIDEMKAEAIEAELVFLIRKETNAWPLYQNEIHFHNQKGAYKSAEGIYTRIYKN